MIALRKRMRTDHHRTTTPVEHVEPKVLITSRIVTSSWIERRRGRSANSLDQRSVSRRAVSLEIPQADESSGWFCLSNPKVTKHLIVAIGQETYVTLPKGQLIPTTRAHITQAGQEPLVPGGGHVLVSVHRFRDVSLLTSACQIIPIAHHPTLLSIPADDAMNIIAEIESFKSSLRACYAKYDAVPVSFEIGRLQGKGGHAHVQIVPIPKAKADQVADAFRRDGERQGLDWETDPDDALARLGSTANYFKVECPDGTKLVHLLKGNFDLQFGR